MSLCRAKTRPLKAASWMGDQSDSTSGLQTSEKKTTLSFLKVSYWSKSLHLEAVKRTHRSSKGWRRTPEPHLDTQSLSQCLRSQQTFSHSREKKRSPEKVHPLLVLVLRLLTCSSSETEQIWLKFGAHLVSLELQAVMSFPLAETATIHTHTHTQASAQAELLARQETGWLTVGRVSANEGHGWGVVRRAGSTGLNCSASVTWHCECTPIPWDSVCRHQPTAFNCFSWFKSLKKGCLKCLLGVCVCLCPERPST